MRQLSYTIEPEADGLSVNAYARNIAGLSRAFLRSVKFRENGILINGQRVTTRGVLHAGDSLVFNIPNDRTQKVVPAEGPVSIVFENEDIVLVIKPAGLVIHPCHGHYSDTLLSYLAWYYRLLPEQPLLCPIGRLDKDTSGLLVVAKNDAAHQALSAQMSVHSIHRVYHAVVYGNLREDEGFVERWIGRDPHDRKKMAVLAENAAGARYAYTGWRVQERYGNFTYIACKLKTGRTHQIRVHMAHIGHPLAGDSLYGGSDKMIARHALHCGIICFAHPLTAKIVRVESALPADMTALAEAENLLQGWTLTQLPCE